MNYNDKDNKKMEIDDMNIKSRLDTSLDLSGISVSEDLINRTLEAIRNSEQQADNHSTDETDNKVKKFIPWNRYIRAFAGVAAAALIIVAGYGLIHSTGGKKDSSTNMAAPTSSTTANRMMADSSTGNVEGDSSFAAKSTEDNGAGNTTDATEKSTDNATSETAPQFSIAANTSLADTGDGAAAESNGATGSVGATQANQAYTADLPKTDDSETYLTFRDIFLSDPALAQSLKVTDNSKGTSITLTSQDEIQDFYTMMDKQQFTVNTDAAAENNYTVEIAAPDQNEAVYTMTVGSVIIINYTDKNVSSQSIYNVVDNALLLQDLQDFFNKYYK